MPTLKFSINVDPEEPRTFGRIPTIFAIISIQILIIVLFVGLAIGCKQPAFLIFSAAQALISFFFLVNFVYFILVHLYMQFAGLICIVGIFVGLILDLFNNPSNAHNTNAYLWILWFTTIVYIYYVNIVFRHVEYLWKQTEKPQIQTIAPTRSEENVYQNFIRNQRTYEEQFPLPKFTH